MAISLLLAYWGQVDMVATLQTSHHHLLFPWLCYFSSAAHIDCILLSVTIFPNLIDSFDFYLIFATFGLNVHNNIAPKPVQLLWGFLRLNFNYQKRSKLGFLEVFGPFSQQFLIWDSATWFTCISGYLQECVKYGIRSLILGPFLTPNKAKIKSKVHFSSILQYVSARFTWKLFLSLLGLFPQGPYFQSHFQLRIEPK